MDPADVLIETLQLQPHPEGGYYKETYRAAQEVKDKRGQCRNACTAIYYLLRQKEKSHFHRLRHDECWFFHQGTPVEIYCLEKDAPKLTLLGNDWAAGQTPQCIIPAGTWFAARLHNGTGFALVSCTVAPGFDFADFEMAERDTLLASYSDHRELIAFFTQD